MTQVAGSVETTTETKTETTAAVQDKSIHLYLKLKSALQKFKGDTWIAGVGEGHSIYQNSRGEYFYIDPNTGDQRMVSSDYFMKMDTHDGRKAFVLPHVLEKSGTITNRSGGGEIKGESKVTLLGVDEKGNVIQTDSRGEKFYLDLRTGDKVFLK